MVSILGGECSVSVKLGTEGSRDFSYRDDVTFQVNKSNGICFAG